MELDRIIHDKKNFFELEDADIEAFLKARRFNTEHLNLEFKRDFPRKKDGKFRITEICGYIAGFSNSDGGVIVYGVGDEVKDASVVFPRYIHGVASPPSREDLSEWANNFIVPLIQSPSIREFTVDGKKLVVLKIPAGHDMPYLVCPPGTDTFSVFVKTAGGITQLRPVAIKDFYRRRIIAEAQSVSRLAGKPSGEEVDHRNVPKWVTDRREHNLSKLEAPKDFGYIGIYCRPSGRDITIPIKEIKAFLEVERSHFSEALRFAPKLEIGQDHISVGYYPTAIRKDIKSTTRVTVYSDATIAFDAQEDFLMDREGKTLHPYWLAYEIQRHLQIVKAILEKYGVAEIDLVIDLMYADNFKMVFNSGSTFNRAEGAYPGKHTPIVRRVLLKDIHDPKGAQRNIVMPVVKDVMDEISRIFGFSHTLPGVWEKDDYLHYVRGLEHSR